MSFILNIETSTTVCSASVSKFDQVISYREINDGYTHAENLHKFIESCLSEARIKTKDLAAIAVSKGPGSYTGLRIGVSAAKGLAYSLSIPLIAIETLQLMALAAKNQINELNVFYCPMLDARRMEVYTQIYNQNLVAQGSTQALIVNETSVEQFKTYPKLVFFGDGMPKCKDVFSTIPNSQHIENIHPSAKNMSALTYQKFIHKEFEDVAYFEPYYLKDFLILKKQ